MKRRYEMVENKFNDENSKCLKCEHKNLSDEEFQNNNNNNIKNNDSHVDAKKPKFMDYIKDSFRSIKKWFSGGAENNESIQTNIINTNSQSFLIRTNNKSNQFHETIKPMDYSFGIKSPSYKIKVFNDTTPYENMMSSVKLPKHYINGMNLMPPVKLSKLTMNGTNLQRKIAANNPPTRDNNAKRNINIWGSNSFLLRSSKILTPREYNFAVASTGTYSTTPSFNNKNINYTNIEKHSPNTFFNGDIISPNVKPTLLNEISSLTISSVGSSSSSSSSIEYSPTSSSCKLSVENIENSMCVANDTVTQTMLNHSVDYFDLKIMALQALTSRDYHEKEKNMIIEQIKKHQEKRRHLKTQYEPLMNELYFKPEKELFPQLNPELLQKYLDCIKNDTTNGFDIQLPNEAITCKDLKTLLGKRWLNDEVINFYLGLINTRALGDKKSAKYPPVHAFNTFFYHKLTRAGYNGVKRWTKKLNIFEKRFLLIPIHLSIHWCMCIVDNHKKTLNYFDSMLTPNFDCIERIKDYLMEEHMTKFSLPLNFNGWLFNSPSDIPKQENGCDCGVFACTFGEYAARDMDFNFAQIDMPYFRQKMIYEIFQNKLLL